MTFRSLKKRRTTRPSISLATSPLFGALTALAFALVLAENASASKSLQWGKSGVKQAVALQPIVESAAVTFRDPQVIAAAWEEADAAVEVEKRDPLYVAQLRSVVVKRSTSAEDVATETPLSEERFAELPADPFDDASIKDYVPQDTTESVDLFEAESIDLFDTSETAPEEQTLPPAEQAAAEAEPEAAEADDYDLFNEPLNLFETAPEAVAPETENLEVDMPEAGSDFSPQQPAEDEKVDLWLTSEEIAPIEEPAVGPRTGTGSSDIFEKLTQPDTDSGELERRLDYQYEELERDLIESDPDDWLNYDLLQPSDEELSEAQRKLLDAEREEHRESCQEEIDKLRLQKLENIDLSIDVEGNPGEDYPFECNFEPEAIEPRDWPQITYMWKASGLCHKPLYFEQVQLERYGHCWGPIAQPLLSGVHFFGTLPVLPYKMGLKTPNECVYSLGYYRPGNCAPYMIDAIPFTWRAAGYQAGVVTGMSFILP